jgi:3'-5' exoribonuclease
MNKKQFVKDLKLGDAVDSPFLVLEMKFYNFSQQKRPGERFARLLLADTSGSIKSILWNGSLAEELSLSPGVVVNVRGEVGEYNGLQVTVNSLEVLPEEQVNRRYFQNSSLKEPKEMLARLSAVMDREITHPQLRLLLYSFFKDKEFARLFAMAPAARKVHHNYLGGLLEHTLEVVDHCLLMLKVYPGRLHPSLLLTGAILHDIGKLEEYDVKSLAFNLTDRGKLLGHICIGLEMVQEKLKALENFPAEIRLELEHMLLSHHGEKEWGSPEVPKTFNAYALFHADLVSARLNQFAGLMEKGQGVEAGWSEWDRLLERSVYLLSPEPAGAGETGQ